MFLAIALLFTGCGGTGANVTSGSAQRSPSVSTASASGESADRFKASAQLICSRLHRQLAERAGGGSSLAEIESKTPANARLEKAANGELEHLSPPPAHAEAWRRLLAARRTLALQLEQLAEAARHRQEGAVAGLSVAKARGHKALVRLGQEAGVPTCGAT